MVSLSWHFDNRFPSVKTIVDSKRTSRSTAMILQMGDTSGIGYHNHALSLHGTSYYAANGDKAVLCRSPYLIWSVGSSSSLETVNFPVATPLLAKFKIYGGGASGKTHSRWLTPPS